MPVVSTKLTVNDYKILKSLAEGQGDTIAAYVRKQLRPRISSSNLTSAQAVQHKDTQQQLQQEENKSINTQSTPTAKPVRIKLRV
jgi:hypothetical protein